MRRILHAGAAFLALGLAACAPAEEAPPEVGPLPPGAEALLDTLRSGELQLLREHASHLSRPTWDRLVIRCDDGTVREFVDLVAQGALARVHVARSWLSPIERYLVEVVEIPEGGQYQLVDRRNGAVVDVDAPPVISLDGDRFVTTSLDLVAGHRPNRMRIYRSELQGLAIEWQLEPDGWGARNAVWVDSNTVRVERVELDLDSQPHVERVTPLTVKRYGPGWRMEDASAPE